MSKRNKALLFPDKGCIKRARIPGIVMQVWKEELEKLRKKKNDHRHVAVLLSRS